MDNILKVGKWIIYPHLCEISDGEKVIHLEPKSMDLLVLLASAKGELVSRKQIMDVVWKDRVVTEYALNNLISGLRKQLNQKGEAESYIITRPKLGYRLIANVESIESPEESALDPADNVTDQQKSSTDAIAPELSQEENKKNTLRKHPVLMSLFVLFIVTLSFVFWWTTNNTDLKSDAKPLEITPSIVVLPFDVFDADDDISYFADGLAEEIIHQLTVVPNLKVISRTSSFYFRDKDLPLTEIANILDVSYVLEGSVRKVEDTMRVTVQLIQANDDTHIWSKVFTANQANRFGIQYEISKEVAHSIDSSFKDIPDDKRLFVPASSEAYLRVLKGRKLNQQGTPDATVQARDEFLMATLLAPDYADAYVNLGVNYLLLIQQNKLTKKDAMEHASQAINRALELDPELASAYAAKGLMHQVNNDIDQAQAAFKQALDINPDLYLAIINYANFLRKFARYDSALEYYTKAKNIAPLSGAAQWGLGNVLLRMGRIEESVNQYRNCVNLLTNHVDCHYGYAYALRLADRTEDADLILEKINKIANKNDFWFNSISAFHALWQGNFESAEALYESLAEDYGLNNDFVLSMPLLKVRLGQTEEWIARLAEILRPEATPRANVSVHSSYAMSAYYDGQCNATITHLEKILEHRAFLFDELEYIATATHYAAALAYCYQQQNRKDDFTKALALSDNLLSTMPEQSRHIGTFRFARAQNAILKGKVNEAKQILDELRAMEWQLMWLIELDPIVKNINSPDVIGVND